MPEYTRMFGNNIRVTVVQVIKTGMLERLGETPCNSRTHYKKNTTS